MANKIDPREESYFPPDWASMLIEYDQGIDIASSTGCEKLDKTFKWKRGFQNGWLGNPSDGKTTMFLFLTVLKCKIYDWKACLWMPEMMGSYVDKKTGKVRDSANDIHREIAFMLTGINPYKHYADDHNMRQITLEEYEKAREWIEEHIFICAPKDESFDGLIDHFQYYYETFGCDIFLIDTWKDIDHKEDGRTDTYITKLLKQGRKFARSTNTSLNYILHPRSDKEVRKKDGSYKVVDQFMISGGAAFNQTLDGLFSVYRPYKHDNPNDPRVELYTLKQRKQQLVARIGVCTGIEFDWKTNRFYWSGVCPIDGSMKAATQTGIDFEERYKKKPKEKSPLEVGVDEPPF